MATSRDISNAAEHLIKQHGATARRFATVNADHLADRQDRTGAGYWISIAEAVQRIEASITTKRMQA